MRAGGTGRSEYVLATFGSLAGSAFAAVEGLPAGYRLEYNLSGKQIRLVKIDVGVTATAVAGGIYLTWASPEVGATSYTVRRATTPGGPYTVVATDIAGTSFLDSAVVNGTTYYYTVQSNLGAFSDEASALFSVAVRNLAASPGYNTVGLSWTPVDAGAVTYNILRATSPGGAHTIIASGITASSYADNTAVNGTTYYYSVQSQSGAVSGEVSATPTGAVGALPPPWARRTWGRWAWPETPPTPAARSRWLGLESVPPVPPTPFVSSISRWLATARSSPAWTVSAPAARPPGAPG